jgi:phosphoserine phosphatase
MEIKTVLADMDGCVLTYKNEPYNSSWDAISEALSCNKEWIKIRDFYVGKKDKYAEWFEKQVGMLEGLTVKESDKVLFPVPYSRGAVDFFNSLDGNYVKGLVSSGINIVAEKVKEELNLDFQISNYLEIKKRVFTGKGKEIVGLNDKLQVLEDVLEQHNIKLNETCFIGDNFNDVPVFEKVGLAVAYNPKTEDVGKKADYIIYDFRELNKILDRN